MHYGVRIFECRSMVYCASVCARVTCFRGVVRAEANKEAEERCFAIEAVLYRVQCLLISKFLQDKIQEIYRIPDEL